MMLRGLIAAIALCPAAATAEGARMVLDCLIEAPCEAGADCGLTELSQIHLEIVPMAVDAEGAGDYWIDVGSSTTEARALSRTGPYVWTNDAEEQATLLILSEDEALYVLVDATGERAPTIQHLTCEVTL